jgi:hypothetical protein
MLAAHPAAPRESREFLTRTLDRWQLGTAILFASLVVGELVASSSINAGNDIDLSFSWNRSALRLTVRDHRPALPGQSLDLRRPGLSVLAGLSRGFGFCPPPTAAALSGPCWKPPVNALLPPTW